MTVSLLKELADRLQRWQWGGKRKQRGPPSKSRLYCRDTGNNKWIKVIHGGGKKKCEENLEADKGETFVREAAML